MAYKVFQNGFPLPASDLNNYLMNQSVIVFADSAARSAAITTPVEGMLTYLESTNAYEGWNGTAWTDINDNTNAIPKSTVTTAGDLIVATGSAAVTRLGIGGSGALLKSNGTTTAWEAVGTNGYVLTSTGTDVTWTEIASSGMTQIATTSMSGATSFTSIPGTYKDLRLVITNFRGSSGTNGLNIGFNSGTSHMKDRASSSATAADTWSNTASITSNQNTATANGMAIVNIYDYATTVSWKVGDVTAITNDNTTATSNRLYMASFGSNITAAITSIQIAGLGTIAAGTATLFGVK
jgi:hypothetical protein